MLPHYNNMNYAIQPILVAILLAILTGIMYYHRNPTPCRIEPMIERLRQDLIKLDPRAESLQFFPSNESYTEDKEKVFLCLKDANGEYYPYNQLLEVAIHELAHAICPVVDVNHTSPEWNQIFQQLLQQAVNVNMYNPSEPRIPNYCQKS